MLVYGTTFIISVWSPHRSHQIVSVCIPHVSSFNMAHYQAVFTPVTLICSIYNKTTPSSCGHSAVCLICFCYFHLTSCKYFSKFLVSGIWDLDELGDFLICFLFINTHLVTRRCCYQPLILRVFYKYVKCILFLKHSGHFPPPLHSPNPR